jgi:hypothetical protein
LLRTLRGLSIVDEHHYAGAANSVEKVDLNANDHGFVTNLNLDANEMFINPTRSPLINIAARVQGTLNLLRLIVDRWIGPIPQLLVSLDTSLCEKLGPEWWQEFPIFKRLPM